jgi:sulfide:quinone oxidoreductase
VARVLVLGAGFGGIATAVALRGQLAADDEVVLVDRRDDFAMGLRKTWAILGISPIAYGTRSLASLSMRGITFRQGTVERVDPANRAATVDGASIEADALVIALGAEQALDAVPGLSEHGLNAWDRSHLDQVHGIVDRFRGGHVSDRFDARGIDADVSVFAPIGVTLPILGASGCIPLDARLEERGIRFLPGHLATAVGEHAVQFAERDDVSFGLLLAVPPHRCPSVLVEAGLASPGSWVGVDRATLETDHPGVYAIGDSTVIGLANGMPLPKAGLFAEKEGEAVAARIAARLRGDEPSATFDGRGSCFVEMGDGEASTISGDFFGDPPAVELSVPSASLRAEKERFEMDRLARWFGA